MPRGGILAGTPVDHFVVGRVHAQEADLLREGTGDLGPQSPAAVAPEAGEAEQPGEGAVVYPPANLVDREPLPVVCLWPGRVDQSVQLRPQITPLGRIGQRLSSLRHHAEDLVIGVGVDAAEPADLVRRVLIRHRRAGRARDQRKPKVDLEPGLRLPVAAPPVGIGRSAMISGMTCGAPPALACAAYCSICAKNRLAS
jgi:hypothetical protein